MNLAERFKKEKIVINCETEWEAEKFIDWCYENGMQFMCGGKRTHFKGHKEKICYEYYCDVNKNRYLVYSNIDLYELDDSYTVIKYKDFFKGDNNMIKVKDIAEKYGEYEIDESKLKELLVKPKPKTVWDLQKGDTYYFIVARGEIIPAVWRDYDVDEKIRSTGSCFLTYEEAEFEVERRKVETELLRLGGTRDMMSLGCLHNEKYYIYYDNQSNSIEVNYNYCNQEHNIYFKNRKDCWDAIEKIGIDRIKKYLFHVEDDK